MDRRDFLKGLAAGGLTAGFAGLASAAERIGAADAVDPQTAAEALAQPKAHTFSICAVNAQTGEAGVAVASKCLSVGALVCYAEPGVGAIATQATVNPRYGREGLELLRKDLPAAEVVRRLVEQDLTIAPDEERFVKLYAEDGMTEEGVDFFRIPASKQRLWLTSRIRQLGVVDRRGNAVTHDGARAISWAGSKTGRGYSCQGNMLAGEKVITEMAAAFERTREGAKSLAVPLLAAIQAGEAAGGDKRGKQAAAMLVVRDRGHWTGSDRWCDVRVDDHAEPVAELGRILKKNRFVE